MYILLESISFQLGASIPLSIVFLLLVYAYVRKKLISRVKAFVILFVAVSFSLFISNLLIFSSGREVQVSIGFFLGIVLSAVLWLSLGYIMLKPMIIEEIEKRKKKIADDEKKAEEFDRRYYETKQKG